MKEWKCITCGKDIEVEDDYEYEFCCEGRDCNCKGLPINPAFCDECENKIFGKVDD